MVEIVTVCIRLELCVMQRAAGSVCFCMLQYEGIVFTGNKSQDYKSEVFGLGLERVILLSTKILLYLIVKCKYLE